MNSSRQIAIAFVCALMLVTLLSSLQKYAVLRLAMFTSASSSSAVLHSPQTQRYAITAIRHLDQPLTSFQVKTNNGNQQAQPKALGTVQIVIGVVNFMFGIVRTTFLSKDHPVIIVKSGITYWGSLFYVSGGSLSVAAQNKLHPCVVKASLGMNVINAITAGISIVLMSIEIKYDLGISGILLVFSILQFIISIYISGFACKATCKKDSQTTVVNVALNQGY
ncbi:membrane-spanning 4-domain, subfamily A, member 17C.1 [Pimephales promelas]|nr:membrane-spanning 4-domain, subfamily A, member 17C.1 [Pimephales promelas]